MRSIGADNSCVCGICSDCSTHNPVLSPGETRWMPLMEAELPESHGFSNIRVAQSLVFCVVLLIFWREMFAFSFVLFILAIALSLLLRLMASDYLLGILTLFKISSPRLGKILSFMT